MSLNARRPRKPTRTIAGSGAGRWNALLGLLGEARVRPATGRQLSAPDRHNGPMPQPRHWADAWTVKSLYRLLSNAARSSPRDPPPSARPAAPSSAECGDGASPAATTVRIRTLGTFEIRIGNEPICARGKPQRRILELLKALLALGGRPVLGCELADRLWPDADGDSAQNSLQVSLYRLRRLLGRDDAILVQGGRVSLNPGCCWVDAWEFDAQTECLRQAQRGSPGYLVCAHRLVALYAGHFLSDDREQPWLLVARERLRRHWLCVVRSLGEVYETHGAWATAAEVYEHALQIDPANEDLHQRLMICWKTVGNRSEAAQAYRRCRQQLDALLGIPPSAETERVYQSVRVPG